MLHFSRASSWLLHEGLKEPGIRAVRRSQESFPGSGNSRCKDPVAARSPNSKEVGVVGVKQTKRGVSCGRREQKAWLGSWGAVWLAVAFTVDPVGQGP